MRVDKKQLDSLRAANNTGASQRIGQQSPSLSTTAAGASGADQASLSSASNLVALARTATSADRQAKLQSLTQQVQTGSYQGDTGRAGQAMVSELLQRGSSALQ